MKKIVFVTSTPITIEVFLTEYIQALSKIAEPYVVTNLKGHNSLVVKDFPVRLLSVPIERSVSPLLDLSCLIRLYRLLKTLNVHSVHSVTPKAGFISMLAGVLAHVPHRIHTFTGQVWAHKRGATRSFLKFCDSIISHCATHILADSHSQREFLIREKVVRPEKIAVLGAGSISGVDTERFKMDENARNQLRRRMGIKDDDTAFLFLGRLNRDKGVYDLADAFCIIANKYGNVHLLMVGPDEESVCLNISRKLEKFRDRLHFEGYTPTPELYMSASDVLCLPSYREGFGVVIIEAASVGIPAIGSRIYGIVDAIVENETGLLFEPGNISELAYRMELMVREKEKRKLMGLAARKRVLEYFTKERLVQEFLTFYSKILGN